MTAPHRLTLYLNPGTQARLAGGRQPFLARVVAVAEAAGVSVSVADDSARARAASAERDEYALFHMAEPTHDRALTMRRVYAYPFWQIETTARRWDWQVARDAFPAGTVPRKAADRFFRFWGRRQFGDAVAAARREGFIYVPLQGRLTDHRSFQTMSPMAMLEAVLAADPRPVVATLHPREDYSVREIAALEALQHRFPRLRVETGDMVRWLGACDLVVTQNSSAGFFGYFFAKPCVLFARIDFHHIAATIRDMGVPGAIAAAEAATPDHAGYLHWFWQRRSINAGRDDADDRIAQALRRGGWPV